MPVPSDAPADILKAGVFLLTRFSVYVPVQKLPCVAKGDAHSTHREATFGGSARDYLAAPV
jgi:hypothetical protein